MTHLPFPRPLQANVLYEHGPGKTWEHFHQATDNKQGGVFVLAQLGGKTFGAYTSEPISKSNAFVRDPKAFLFRVDDDDKKAVVFGACRNPDQAVLMIGDNFPSWGRGSDFMVKGSGAEIVLKSSTYENVLDPITKLCGPGPGPFHHQPHFQHSMQCGMNMGQFQEMIHPTGAAVE